MRTVLSDNQDVLERRLWAMPSKRWPKIRYGISQNTRICVKWKVSQRIHIIMCPFLRTWNARTLARCWACLQYSSWLLKAVYNYLARQDDYWRACLKGAWLILKFLCSYAAEEWLIIWYFWSLRRSKSPPVFLSRPDKSGHARISGHLGKIARITPRFLWFCPDFCDLVPVQKIMELFAKRQNTGLNVP